MGAVQRMKFEREDNIQRVIRKTANIYINTMKSLF